MKPINNTNSFSLTRLWQVLKVDMRSISTSRQMYFGFAILFLASQLGGLSECIATYHLGAVEAAQLFEHFSLQQAPIFYAFLFGMMLFCIASMVKLGDKSDAIYYLTLPASNKEKFVSSAMIAVIEPILITSFAMLTADLVRIGIVEYRMAVTPDYAILTNDFHGITLPHLFGRMPHIVQHWYHFGGTDFVNAEGYISMGGFGFSALHGIMMVLLCIMSILFVHSLFLLVGIYCPNFTVFGITAFVIAVFFMQEKAVDAISSTSDIAISVYGNLLQHEVLSIALLILFVTLTIVNWRTSYRAFTRKQVVMPENFLTKIYSTRKEEAV